MDTTNALLLAHTCGINITMHTNNLIDDIDVVDQWHYPHSYTVQLRFTLDMIPR